MSKTIPAKERLGAAKIKQYFKKEGWRVFYEAQNLKGIELTNSEIQEYIKGGMALDQWDRYRANEQVKRIKTYTLEFINKCAFKRQYGF